MPKGGAPLRGHGVRAVIGSGVGLGLLADDSYSWGQRQRQTQPLARVDRVQKCLAESVALRGAGGRRSSGRVS